MRETGAAAASAPGSPAGTAVTAAAGDAEGRLGLRREPMTAAAAIWVAVQLLLAALTLDVARAPVAVALAALVAAALNAVLLWPLRSGRSRVGAATATTAVALVVAVAVTNTLGVRPDALGTYALWFPGLLSPVVGALAVRGRPGHSAAAATATLAVVVVGEGVLGDMPLWLPASLLFAAPVVLWWVGGVLVERLVRTTQLDLLRSDSAFALTRERRERTRERAAARARRQALLEAAAVPLLQAVARSSEPPDEVVRARLKAVEDDLRAELRGRELLDAAVRRAATGARERGVRVDVVDHAPPGADVGVLPRLRALVAAALEASTAGELTARRPPHGQVLTLVHLGPPASLAAVAAAVAAHQRQHLSLRGLGVDVSQDEDAVVVEVSR